MAKWTPHKYQLKAARYMVSHSVAGLLLGLGLGKTSITYAAFLALRKAGMVERMLVISPLKPATQVWPREATKWDQFARLRIHVLHGAEKDRLLAADHDVSIINPEGLPWLLGKRNPRGRLEQGAAQRLGVWWDMLVVDESTQFKHPNTQRFHVLKPHLPKFRRRYILTGEPAPNGLLDLFGQQYIVDLGRALGQYITRFRSKFFLPTGFGGYDWVPKDTAERDIQEALAPTTLRMDTADYLELPPLIGVDPPLTVEVDLPAKARRAYDQMEALLLADLESGIVTAANAAGATMKCRQIVNGGLYGDNHELHHIHDAKTDAAVDLVEQLQGKPVLIAYEFKHDLERLQRAFPGAPHLGGGVSPKAARAIEDRWNSGALPVLLVQPQSAARGLNLQNVAAELIWYALPWDLELYKQQIARLWRQGQRERVVVHHLVGAATIDDVVLRTLAAKERTQRALLDGLKLYAKSRRH